jgi:hypothetical protein
MPAEKVRGEDSPPVASVNVADMLAGKFKVVADGVSVSMGDKHIDAKKGDEIELDGDAARALLNEGSIKRA